MKKALSCAETRRHIKKTLGVKESTYFKMASKLEKKGLIRHQTTISSSKSKKVKTDKQIFHLSYLITSGSEKGLKVFFIDDDGRSILDRDIEFFKLEIKIVPCGTKNCNGE